MRFSFSPHAPQSSHRSHKKHPNFTLSIYPRTVVAIVKRKVVPGGSHPLLFAGYNPQQGHHHIVVFV
jgi:hypothetical protein